MTNRQKIIFYIFTIPMVIIIACLVYKVEGRKHQLGKNICYTTALSTTKVYKPQNRGTISINDSLFLWSSCEIENLKEEYISSRWSDSSYYVGNLKPIYSIYKNANSDTLYILIGTDTTYCLINSECVDFRNSENDPSSSEL